MKNILVPVYLGLPEVQSEKTGRLFLITKKAPFQNLNFAPTNGAPLLRNFTAGGSPGGGVPGNF